MALQHYNEILSKSKCFCDNNYGTPQNNYWQVDDSECENSNGLFLGGVMTNAIYIVSEIDIGNGNNILFSESVLL